MRLGNPVAFGIRFGSTRIKKARQGKNRRFLRLAATPEKTAGWRGSRLRGQSLLQPGAAAFKGS